MLEILKALQKEYGNITIKELIEKMEVNKEVVEEYWIHKSLIGNIYITSSKKGWELQYCKNKGEAEEKIKELIKEDEINGIKSIYKKKRKVVRKDLKLYDSKNTKVYDKC